jgi:excisionase family DNA binding protein
MQKLDYGRPIFSLTIAEYIDLHKSLFETNSKQVKENNDNIKELLTIQEAAEYLQMSVATLYTFNCRKKIPYVRVTGKIYYRRTALDAWLASGERKTNAQLRREAMEGGAR